MSAAARAVHWDELLSTGAVTWSVELTGFLGADLEGSGRAAWEAVIHPEDLERVRDAFVALRAGAPTHWTGGYRVRAHGTWRSVLEQIVIVDHKGVPVRAVGTVRDAAPAPALADSDRRFQTFVDQLPLLAWEADADGWIDFYNARWFEYTGTTHEQMEGWGWVRVHDVNDLPRQLRVWRSALHSGLPWEDTFRLRRADGALRWHLSRAFPLHDAAGRIVRWFGSNTDIHDQRLALEEREALLRIEQRLRAEADAAAREKDDFVAVVSHELRTPLANVLTRAQILRPGVVDPHLAKGLEKIEHNAQRLARLIEDLLDTSRIISGKLEVGHELADVVPATQTAIEAVTLDANARKVTIHLDAPATALVLGATARLEQIAINLIGNAIKFSHEGGRVSVRVACVGDEVMLEVRDEGVGFEASLRPLLFQRFKQSDSSVRRRHGGLGLGLSIVRHLVLAHGGRVGAESEGPGTGATFWAWIPAAPTDTERARASQPPAVEAAVSLAGIRVLGVDDDADARDVLALALVGQGATVTVASSVTEALEWLRIQVPDIILTDLAMPEIDGLGLAERVRAAADPRVRAVPIVAVTAHANARDRAAVLKAGFDGYIAKPFDPSGMTRLIAQLVRSRLMPT